MNAPFDFTLLSWGPSRERYTPAIVSEQQRRPACPTCGRPAHLAPMQTDVVLRMAEAEFGATREELLSERRATHLVEARAFATWAMRALGRPRSYRQISEKLGRTKATVVNLHLKAIQLRLTNADFAGACERLAFRFYSERTHP